MRTGCSGRVGGGSLLALLVARPARCRVCSRVAVRSPNCTHGRGAAAVGVRRFPMLRRLFLASMVLIGLSPSLATCQDCPVPVAFHRIPSYGAGVVLSGDYAYLAGGTGGLRIIDVSEPHNPVEIGTLDTPGQAMDVAVQGDYAYVADHYQGGLRVIAVSEPSAPWEVGSYDTPGHALGVAVLGPYAYVADYWEGLRVIDVSVPTAPTEVGFIDLPERTVDVVVRDLLAYVGTFAGLWVIDVSNPTAPSDIGFMGTSARASGLVLSGDYAYVAADDYYADTGGLYVVDISNPAEPTQVGYCPLPSPVWDVDVAGNYAYVAGTRSGLRLLDISDPAHPAEVGFSTRPQWAQGLCVADDYVYVTTHAESGLWVFTGLPFSGHCWRRIGFDEGPGNSCWSDEQESSWTDGNGDLHLKIRQVGDQWCQASIQTFRFAEVGQHTFQVSTNLNSSVGGSLPGPLDPDVVLEMSLHRSHHNAIDIQFSDAFPANDGSGTMLDHGVYTVRPAGTGPPCGPGESQCDFEPAMTDDLSTHMIDWSEATAHLTSWHGHCDPPGCLDVMHDWTYSGPNNLQRSLVGPRITLSLWICSDPAQCGNEPYNDHTVVTEQEVIVSAFGGSVHHDETIVFVDDFESADWSEWSDAEPGAGFLASR